MGGQSRNLILYGLCKKSHTKAGGVLLHEGNRDEEGDTDLAGFQTVTALPETKPTVSTVFYSQADRKESYLFIPFKYFRSIVCIYWKKALREGKKKYCVGWEEKEIFNEVSARVVVKCHLHHHK